jgi:hypothetical protein
MKRTFVLAVDDRINESHLATVEYGSGGHYKAQLIADIIHPYNTIWIHRTLRMTREAARAAGMNWRAGGNNQHEDREEFKLDILIAVTEFSFHTSTLHIKRCWVAIHFGAAPGCRKERQMNMSAAQSPFNVQCGSSRIEKIDVAEWINVSKDVKRQMVKIGFPVHRRSDDHSWDNMLAHEMRETIN